MLADAALREAVMQALAADPDLAAGDVRVGVLNAVAHMAGRVPSEGLWHRVAARGCQCRRRARRREPNSTHLASAQPCSNDLSEPAR